MANLHLAAEMIETVTGPLAEDHHTYTQQHKRDKQLLMKMN